MDTFTISLKVPTRPRQVLAIGLIAGLLAGAIASSAFAPRPALAVDPSTPAEHTISVTGMGKVVISPDVADIRLGVSITRPTVQAARADAATLMTRVLAALKRLGIADKDIQTTTLSLQPVYAYSNGTTAPRITGYTLSNGVAATIRDLNKIGNAIDDSLAAGATTFDGVVFRVDDPAAAERQARTDAMTQAKARADTLASAAGVSIIGVASISETAAPTPFPVYYGADRAAALPEGPATPIQPGTTDVTVTVAVAYLIH